MYTWSPQILANLFPENGGPGSAAVLGANPLQPNLSETAWNFQTQFYWIDAYSFRMVYVNFHKHICPRDFSGKGEVVSSRIFLLPNSCEPTWNFQTPSTQMVVDSMRMVYINFHRLICPTEFSMTSECSAPLKPISIHSIFEHEENNSNSPHEHFVDTRAYPRFQRVCVRQGRLAGGSWGRDISRILGRGVGVDKLTYSYIFLVNISVPASKMH